MKKLQQKGHSTLSQTILRVMALFTGLQGFGIICAIIKNKLVTLWLQADGVGFFGILNNTSETIGTLTDLGMRQSAVRDVAISAAAPSGALGRMVTVVRRWACMSGLLGAVVVSALCVPLSNFFFGNDGHWWMFMLLSGFMLLNAMVNGEQAILQGTGRLKALAKASMWATGVGLVASIPMYRFLGERSVVLSILAYGVAWLVFMRLYRYRGERKEVTHREMWYEGKGFLQLGAWLAVAAFITNLGQMLFLGYLSACDGVAGVGYYQAGMTLIVRYMGLIFTAVAMEYYPRLAANIYSAHRTQFFVSYEITLLLLVLMPVVILFLLLRQWVVQFFYSSEFYVIIPFISWAILSCIFKAMSWCMSYVVLARGDGRIYVITETIDAIVGLGLCVAGYYWRGLEGVGIAYPLWYIFYTILVGIVYRRYGFRLSSGVWRLCMISFGVGLAALYIVDALPLWLSMILLLPVAGVYVLPLVRLWRRR